MLQRMRQNVKSLSWTLWVVIIAFIGFVFIEWGTGGMNLRGSDSDVVNIDGTALSGDQFHKDLVKALERYDRQFKGGLNKSFISQLQIPEQILQQNINTLIIQKEADKLDLTVSRDELREQILNYNEVHNDEEQGPVRIYPFRENYQKDGPFIGVKEYERRLAYARIDVTEFERDLKKGIIQDKYRDLVTGGLVIEKEKLKEMYKKENDQAALNYLVFRTDRIKEDIQTEEREIKEYYDQHTEEFKSAEKRRGNVIAFKFEDFKKEVSIPDTELYDYFKENKDQFVTPGKTRVSRILLKYDEGGREEVLKRAEEMAKRLTPANFSEEAKKISQDDRANNGGDWGYTDWKRFTKQELGIIERLEAKQVSSPVDTQDGFSLLLVSEKVPEKQEEFNKVKERISSILEKEQLNSLVRKKLEKIYSKVKDEADIKVAAKAMGIEAVDTGPLTPGEAVKEVDQMGYISRKLFSMEAKEVAFPVEFVKGMAILQLSEIMGPAVQPFVEVKEGVKEKLVLAKKLDLLMKEAKEAANRLNRMDDEEKQKNFLEQNNLKATDYNYKRGDKLAYFPVKSGLDDMIFSLNEKQYSDPMRFKSEVVIVQLKDKTLAGDADFEQERDTFYRQKISELKGRFFTTFIFNKRDDYKIRFNQKLFTEIKDYVISRYK
jgi:peptidyl-prolyl cis-trans isomerase D